MLTIILHHSALELITNSICNVSHNAIKNDSMRRSKKPEEILLDISIHQSAIFPDKLHFAGRPDLVHIFLLQYHFLMDLLETKIKSKIQLFVHTRDNQYFIVPPTWRVPVHFIRFRGLMEKFLLEGKINLTNESSLKLERGSIKDLIDLMKPHDIINLVETGKSLESVAVTMRELIEDEKKTVLLIGGYQKGEYNLSEKLQTKITEIRLLSKPTTAWMVLNLLLLDLVEKK